MINWLRPWLIEIGGGALFLFAAVSIFGLLGLTRSPFLTPWSRFWNELAGWGAYVVFIMLGGLGIHLATRRMERPPLRLTVAQVIGLEILLITALPLSHLLTGTDLPHAYLGQGGGLVGWALSEPLVGFFGAPFTYLLYGSLMVWGASLIFDFGWEEFLVGLRAVSRRLEAWAERLAPDTAVDQPSPQPRRAIGEAPPPQLALAEAAEMEETAEAEKSRRSRWLPPLNLLEKGKPTVIPASEIRSKREIIEQTLRDFGLPAKVVSEQIGPAITQFGVQPGHVERAGPDGQPMKYKIRVGQIAALNKDLALALAAPRVRIEAPVPGKGIVGIEVPNSEKSMVRLGTIVSSAEFAKIRGSLGIGLGLDVSGTAVATDVAKLPHMLVAGQTGSGKSVFMNAIITCLVFNNTPEQLRLVMIDPKKVELIRFNGLPHMLGKVEVEGDRAIGVLRWLTAEMDERYRLFAEVGARNLATYNRKLPKNSEAKKLPHIIAFIDELADLMAMYGGDVERLLARLAQMARATGIHLIVATQRPSTDVITGLIKANFPARLSFAVASGIDSRVILDSNGAEALLGQGDMLFLSADASSPKRIQGCFVSDEEIEAIVQFWRTRWREKEPEFDKRPSPWEGLIERQTFIDEKDEQLERAIALAQQYDTLSTSLLQRRLRVGYPRAARLMETLFEMGLVEDGKTGGKTRKVYTDENVEDPLAEFLAKHGEEYRHYRDKPDFDNLEP